MVRIKLKISLEDISQDPIGGMNEPFYYDKEICIDDYDLMKNELKDIIKRSMRI